MPSEAGFSLVKSIADTVTTRRADPNRAEARKGDGETDARPSTFGALVSEKAAAQAADRPELPQADRPRAQAEDRPAARSIAAREDAAARHDTKRAEKAESREKDAGEKPADPAEDRRADCECGSAEDDKTIAPVAEESKAAPDAGEGAAPVVTSAEAAPAVEAMLVGELVQTPPVELPPADVTGGVSPAPVEETPVPAPGLAGVPGPAMPVATDAEAVIEAAASPGVAMVAKSAVARQTDPTKAGATGDIESDTAAAGTASGEMPAGRSAAPQGGMPGTADAKPDAAIEALKLAESKVEAKDEGKAEAAAKKATTPDLGPTRLSRFADMLEGFGVSNAVHRPADILAGLDRAVQAGAMNRAAEVSRPTPLQMLPIEIGMQAVRGVTNFQIRLDPAELGRVDVKLQIRDNGEVNASLVVDRVETLAMLKRDASTLQYAFEQAGLKQSADGLSFSLRGENQNGQNGRDEGGRAGKQNDEAGLQPQVAEIAMRRAHIPNSSLDLMI